MDNHNIHSCVRPSGHVMDEERQVDELLEIIWDLRESGPVTKARLQESAQGVEVLESIEKLTKEGLITFENDSLNLTNDGEARARNIVRRHRLSERMLADLFEIANGQLEGTSCEFEHILSKEVTDSICTFLGHPTTCPHGRPIPEGECCKRIESVVRPLVMPLLDLDPGENGRIHIITSRDKHRLQRLSSLGIVPGEVVALRQKLPAVVIGVGETEVALDRNLVAEIYVKRVGG